MSVFDKIKEIVVENLACDEADVSENAKLADDLGADSLAAVELIMALEDAFDITVPEDAAKEVKTVADLVKLVDSLQDK